MVVVAVPLGIGAAIYLEEYAPRNRLTSFIEVNVRNLAGVPSVVYGLLGLAVFVEVFGGFSGERRRRPPHAGRRRAHAGGAGAADHDHHHRRGHPGRAAGAARGRLRRRAPPGGRSSAPRCCPTPLPGIITGALLSIARAIGEAAPAHPRGRAHRPRRPLARAELREPARPQLADRAVHRHAQHHHHLGEAARRRSSRSTNTAAAIMAMLVVRPAHQLDRHRPAQPVREEEVVMTEPTATDAADRRGPRRRRRAAAPGHPGPPRRPRPRGAAGGVRGARPQRLLRRLPGGARGEPRRPPARDHGLHRPVGLRQDDGAALPRTA